MSPAGGEDIDKQSQQGPADIHQQPKTGNDIDDRPQNSSAADFEDFGARAADLVWLILENPTS